VTGHAAPTVLDLIEPSVNFLLYAGLMGYLLRGPLREYFRDRTARLREGLEAGAKAREEAEALRAQLEQDLADLPRLRESLKADLLGTAEQQKATLLEAAEQTAARLRSDVEKLATQERASARRVLREDLSTRAVQEATAIVRDALGPEDEQRFISNFVDVARAL